MGVLIHALVIRLEDVGGCGGSGRLPQAALVQHYGEFVLGAGQGHALGSAFRQWQPGQGADPGGQDLVWQRFQPRFRQLPARSQQGERAGRFGAVMLQQAEGVGRIEVGALGKQPPRTLLRQQVVEEPLHRAQAGAVDDFAIGAGECRRKVEA